MALDPRVYHSITIEMCTGFLTLAALAIVAKISADVYLRFLGGKVKTLDKIAISASRLAEPTSYFGAVAGVMMTFVSMVTGTIAWPLDKLTMSELTRNKVLVTITTQVIFIVLILFRYRYGFRIWFNKEARRLYMGLAILGWFGIVLQNSIAGHMAGKGSLLDAFLHFVGVDSHAMWYLPAYVSVGIIIAMPVAVAGVYLYLRRSRQSRSPASAAPS